MQEQTLFFLKVGQTGRFVTVTGVTVSSGHINTVSELILSPAGIVWSCPCSLAFKTQWPQGDCPLEVFCFLYIATTIKTCLLPSNKKLPWTFMFPANLPLSCDSPGCLDRISKAGTVEMKWLSGSPPSWTQSPVDWCTSSPPWCQESRRNK